MNSGDLPDLDEIVSSPLIPWERLSGRTLLVTGGGGMLGSYLVRAVLRANRSVLDKPACVIAPIRSPDRALSALGPSMADPMLRILHQDVSRAFSLDSTPIDYIVHAASPASPAHYASSPVDTITVNTLGTANLLELARERNVDGFLFLSSSEVYGQLISTEGLDESSWGALDPTQVRSCYAEGKRAGETLCVAYHHQFGTPATIARPFHTYGPTMRLDDGRVYADLVADIIAGRNLALNSDGAARRAFCYVTDATIAFLLLLLRGARGEAYNVGNPGEERSILELAQLLVSLFPERGLEVTSRPPAPGYLASKVARSSPSITKLQGLGWEPRTSAQEGFRRVILHHEGH